ncbi:MAG: hypothetical protein R2844_17910 [Caldilineales bacterium]
MAPSNPDVIYVQVQAIRLPTALRANHCGTTWQQRSSVLRA